jgi:hypothetical protein
MMPKSTVTTITLPNELLEKLRVEAKKKGLSMAGLIRWAVIDKFGLPESEKEDERNEGSS